MTDIVQIISDTIPNIFDIVQEMSERYIERDTHTQKETERDRESSSDVLKREG